MLKSNQRKRQNKIYNNMKNILAKLFGGAGGSIAEKISGIIDKHTFSKGRKSTV